MQTRPALKQRRGFGVKQNTNFMKIYKEKALISSFNVEQDLKDQIIEVCNDRNIHLTEFLNKAITAYLNTLNRNK